MRDTYESKYRKTCNNANEIATVVAAAEGDEAEVDSSATPPETISFEVSAGRLGLSVNFSDKKEGAMISEIHDTCMFKNQVNVGDRILAIDGHSLCRPEDLAIGMEQVSRTIDIVAQPKRSSSVLSREHITALNSIGFNWEGAKRFRPWELSFNDLLTYYKTNADFCVPRSYKTPESFLLGEWVHNQRTKYKKRDPFFMANRAHKLEAIAFEWVPAKKSDFKTRFKELVDYKHIHGHVDVPCNNSNNSPYRNLGRWVHSVRGARKRLDERDQHGRIVEEKRKGGHSADYLPAERITVSLLRSNWC